MKNILLSFLCIPFFSTAAVYNCEQLSTAPISGDGSVNLSSVHVVEEQPISPIRVSLTTDVITIFDGVGVVIGTSNWVGVDNNSLEALNKNGNSITGVRNMGETIDGKSNWNVAGFIEGNKFYVTTATNYVTLASGCSKAK